MNSQPLNGSKIEVGFFNGYEQIILPHGEKGIATYLVGLFLLFWMGGWAMGFVTALTSIITTGGHLFLIFWLGAWTVGGIYAGTIIYRIFRPSAPEKLLLNKPNLSFDTGKPPLKLYFSYSGQKEFFKSLFKRRRIFEFDRSSIKTLALRDDKRLTIDNGIDRIEIGKNLTEIEREWLHGILAKAYL